MSDNINSRQHPNAVNQRNFVALIDFLGWVGRFVGVETPTYLGCAL